MREVADRIAAGVIGATRIRFGAVAIAELVELDGLLVAISNLAAPELNSAYVVREPTHPASVGIYGVSVIPAARHRGIGAAIIDVCARAFRDADLVWLQASEMGLGMYERLGFRRVADWEVWVRP